MKKKFYIYISVLLCGAALLFAFSPVSNDPATPIPAPSGMQINITNTTALDWSNCNLYPNHEMKVTFYGSRYSDGQDVSDPNSPFTFPGWYFQNPSYAQCENFYYQDGQAVVYTRENSSSSWDYQGYMLMSSSNCTKDGSKVTYFTVNCMYLGNQD